MKTIEDRRTTAAAEPAARLLLDGIRELSRGNEQAALETFAAALHGDDVLGALCAARLHLLRRERVEAECILTLLLRQHPGLAEAHFMLGQVHREEFRVMDAMRSFREALLLDPGHAGAEAGLTSILDAEDP